MALVVTYYEIPGDPDHLRRATTDTATGITRYEVVASRDVPERRFAERSRPRPTRSAGGSRGDRRLDLEVAERAIEREKVAGGIRDAARAGRITEANEPKDLANRFERVIRTETAAAVAVDAAPIEAVRQIALERVFGRNDLVGVAYLELAASAAKSVARVQIKDRAGRVVGFGTGFMVSPRLLLTNHHVLPDAEVARHSVLEFDYQDDPRGDPVTPAMFDLRPDAFFEAAQDLDYALTAVADASREGTPLSTFGWMPLNGVTGKVANGEYLNIIQHPNGEPKQLALRENRLVDKLPRHLHYESDTAPGSSGSPVLNDQWEVVALHHAAYPVVVDGKIMSVDKVPWEPGMGEERIAWKGNEGVRVSVLVDAFRRLEPDVHLAELFEAPRPDPLAAHRRSADEGSGHAPPAVERTPAVPSRCDDGSMTWTIPVEVTVGLGGWRSADIRVAAPLPPGPWSEPAHANAPGPRTAPVGAGPDDRPGDDEAVRALLALHERADAEPYYDLDGDGALEREYYRTVDLDLTGADLRRALGKLLKETHRPSRYDPMRLVYPRVDKHPDRKLRSIYSGRPFGAEEIVRADLEVDRQRTRFREALRGVGPAGAEAATFEFLESSLPYNCEHVVPQSWFGKREPQRGDLHHLFTCESGCNSFRGNIPYWDFPDFEEAVRSECGKRETDKFEPSDGKGAVARATFYFLTRYAGDIDDRYDASRLAMLAAWSQAKPVGPWERHRNAVIHDMQGNRNPFIDFPGLERRLFA